MVTFEPTLLAHTEIPERLDKALVDGVTAHLRRYGSLQSSRNAIARLEDPVWLAAWREALARTSGRKVLMHGSELGVFALRALQAGASEVLAVEASALDGRIASGIVQKHFLAQWHARHGEAIASWSEEERRASFEKLAHVVDVVAAESERLASFQPDCVVFPNIDHSLLGTGIVKAIREQRAQVLPARARVFAMGIQWQYPSDPADWEPLNRLRWSPSPTALDLPPEAWVAITERTLVGEIDLQNFAAALWQVSLPVSTPGRVDAILFWFELDLGGALLSNAPDSDLQCIKPAVQYVDPVSVQPGHPLQIRVTVGESRLQFDRIPASTQIRSGQLAGWQMPMLLDRHRKEAYAQSIRRALSAERIESVVEIGAGCGLLSMLAAQAGARHVTACEPDKFLADAGKEIIAAAGYANRIALLNEDCRRMTVPAHMPERADLVIFDLFDSTLIGGGVLHFLAHARSQLLRPGARYLPQAATIRAVLIEHRFDEIWGIDAKLLNPYRHGSSFTPVDADRLQYRRLSEPVDVFTFDFTTATPAEQDVELRLPVTADGAASAVLFWFDLQLDADTRLSNEPGTGNSLHWRQGMQFLQEARVDTSMTLPLIAKHDGSQLTFKWQKGAVPAEAFARVPVFDPRAVAAATALDRQTREMLHHCRQNEATYADVADLAMRFAVDPASHGIDPGVARRFAAAFLGA